MVFMKIAFLSEKYTPDIGGLAISAARLAGLLTSAGHNVRVFCPSLNLPASEKQTLPHNGISVTRFGAHKRVDDTLIDWFEFVTEEHKREPFDVLNAYFLTQAGFIAAFAGNYLNVPSVVSARGNDLERAIFDPSRAAHILYALGHSNAVTTNASELAKKARALIPSLEVSVIPNGIDTGHFKLLEKNTRLAESLGLIAGDSCLSASPVVSFVGEWREKKELKTLLTAYTQVNKKHLATLLIVGDIRAGEDKRVFEEFKLSNPDSHIIVTGFVSPNDLPAYYSLLDVYVQPSLRDGLPNALLEAMACEKAVIGTSVGGIVDAVTDGENGKLIPAKDPYALADAICNLLSDETLRKKYGSAARQTIMSKFTPEMELEGNLSLYRKLGLNA
jgi:glycosyltransferase involved in cell wall biosynthesis